MTINIVNFFELLWINLIRQAGIYYMQMLIQQLTLGYLNIEAITLNS